MQRDGCSKFLVISHHLLLHGVKKSKHKLSIFFCNHLYLSYLFAFSSKSWWHKISTPPLQRLGVWISNWSITKVQSPWTWVNASRWHQRLCILDKPHAPSLSARNQCRLDSWQVISSILSLSNLSASQKCDCSDPLSMVCVKTLRSKKFRVLYLCRYLSTLSRLLVSRPILVWYRYFEIKYSSSLNLSPVRGNNWSIKVRIIQIFGDHHLYIPELR